MQLSPEERHKIYEEEKERIDAEQKQRMTADGGTTGLEPNIAALLCYLGGWITGDPVELIACSGLLVTGFWPLTDNKERQESSPFPRLSEVLAV